MLKRLIAALAFVVAAIALYLLLWPVPIAPVAWQAPPNPGYTGPFAPNDRLKGIDTLPVGDNRGPEAVALDAEGRIYASTHEGRIVRLQADGTRPENWVETDSLRRRRPPHRGRRLPRAPENRARRQAHRARHRGRRQAHPLRR